MATTTINVNTAITNGVTPINSGVAGRVLYQNSANKVGQNSGLFFDEANERMSIGQGSSPLSRLDVRLQGVLSTDLGARFRNSGNTYNILSLNGQGRMILNSQASSVGMEVIGSGSAFGDITNNFRGTAFDNSFQIGQVMRSGYNQTFIDVGGNGTGSTVYNRAVNILGNNLDRRTQFVVRGNLVLGDYSTFAHHSELSAATGALIMQNSAVQPSTNIANAGQLYVEGGALKFRGSAGTVTTIANA